MEFSRLKRIIEYNNEHQAEIRAKVKELYSKTGMEDNSDFLNVMQVIRPLLRQQLYIVVELPFKDKEIGALCYNGDGLGYAFLNSSLPKVNVNFALCHEIYHVFFGEKPFSHKVELYMNKHYYEDEEELAANSFAGVLLMPEQSFSHMFRKFSAEAGDGDSEMTPVVKLMSYFEVPYMAALIRCYELDLLKAGDVMKTLLAVTQEQIEQEFARLWLDESILNAQKRDDFAKLLLFVQSVGEDSIKKGILSERMLDRALANMKKLYREIKE